MSRISSGGPGEAQLGEVDLYQLVWKYFSIFNNQESIPAECQP